MGAARLQQYVEEGGHLLIASARPPEFPVVRAIATTPDVKGYVRVRDHGQFPSLADTDLLLLDGPFTTLEGDGANSLSLVPPSMIGPPEKVHVDMRDTSTPAIVSKNLGQGLGSVAALGIGSAVLSPQSAGTRGTVPRCGGRSCIRSGS